MDLMWVYTIISILPFILVICVHDLHLFDYLHQPYFLEIGVQFERNSKPVDAPSGMVSNFRL